MDEFAEIPGPMGSSNEFTLLSLEEKDRFEAVKNDTDQFDLTQDLLKNPDFAPQARVDIGDYNFYMSKVIKTNGYLQALMYVPDRDYRLLPRVFYKSNSDGGWRSCPGAKGERKRYSKGNGIHYTQETKPHEDLIAYLDAASKNHLSRYDGDIIQEYFSTSDGAKPEWDTFDVETARYYDRGTLAALQEYRPGYYATEYIGHNAHLGDKFKDIDFTDPKLVDFVPDFTKGPQEKSTVSHTLLGDITTETYKGAELNGRPVKWVMAQDKAGRAWVDRITFDDDRVNSYGVHPEVIDSGALTNKPIEYASHATGLVIGTESKYFDKNYVDITPLLKNLGPIKEFIKAHSALPEKELDNLAYDLTGGKGIELTYNGKPIIVKLPRGQQLEIGMVEDLNLGKGMSSNVDWLIIQRAIFDLTRSTKGFKGLRDKERIEVGRDNPGRFVFDSSVSRMHLEISRTGSQIHIKDLESKNGTHVVQNITKRIEEADKTLTDTYV